MKKEMRAEVKIPQGTNITLDNSLLTVKGAKGEVKRNFKHQTVKIELKDGKVVLTSQKSNKKQKRFVETFKAHIKNMIRGSNEGHEYVLKICSGHFPMNVSISGTKFSVKNYLGEKIPREIKLNEGAKVKIEGDLIKVEGTDIEKVSQCAASIEQITRITNRDRRVFMDGIWMIKKDGEDIV